MNLIENGIEATSSGKAAPVASRLVRFAPLVLTASVSGTFTSADAGELPLAGDFIDAPICSDWTGSGPCGVITAPILAVDVPTQLGELRRLTGLTLDELALCFGVSRRSVHFWMAGKEPSAEHAQRLHRFVDVMREVDQGSAPRNRAKLRGAIRGRPLLDLVQEGDWDRLHEVLAPTAHPRPQRQVRTQEAVARAQSLPLSPATLLQAEESAVDVKRGPVSKVRVSRRGDDGGAG